MHSRPVFGFTDMLLTATFACLLVVSSTFAERSLLLSLSGPSSFRGSESMSIATTLTNTGDEELVLLNAPFTVLSDLPTRKFSLSNENGESPRFVGAVSKYLPDIATRLTKLAPGYSLSVNHSLADVYEFTHGAAGWYSIEPSSSMFLVLTDEGIQKIFATTSNHVAHISDIRPRQFSQQNVLVDDTVLYDGSKDLSDNIDKLTRPRFIGCSNERQRQIIFAAQEAQLYARRALEYLSSHKTTSSRYKEWFGTFTTARHKRVLSNFQKISALNFGATTYNCNCNTDDYAYVIKNRPGQIWFCQTFWGAPTKGTNSRAGTIVHEASHWTVIADTYDHEYGQGPSRGLALLDPEMAIANADNHEYFAENTPWLS